MIDLRIDQYRLRFYGLQWTVVRITVTGEKSANPGVEKETDHGYHARLSHALQDVFDRLNGSEAAESVEALLTAVQTHARAITEAAADADRQLLALRHGKE